MSTVAVLGGGIAGLSSAYFLSRLPLTNISKIVVIEGSNRLGGWIQSERLQDGTVFEGGPRSFRFGGKVEAKTLELIEMLGLQNDVLKVPREKMVRRLYYGGKLKVFPTDFDKWTLATTTFKGVMKDRWMLTRKEDESVKSFIEKRFGSSPEIMAFVESMFRGIYASSYDNISHKFSMLGKSESKSLIHLTQKMAEAKKELLNSDSELVRQAAKENWEIYGLRKGTGQIVDGLVEALEQNSKVEILTNTPIDSMDLNSSLATLRSKEKEIVQADHVMSTVLSKNLSSILPAQHQELGGFLSSIPTVSVVVVNLVYDQDLEEVPQGFGHLLPSSEDPPILGVVYDSRVFPEQGPVNTTRLTVMLGGAWMKELVERVGSLNDESVLNLTKETLHKQMNITASPVHTKVHYQMDCIPQHTVGHSQLLKHIYSYIDEHQLPLRLGGCSYREIGVTGIICDSLKEALSLHHQIENKR
uniref:Protoporphyrinogen oxidase n=1 Tax=Magallana gigas TaxID=29159 RepID=A0A8W8IMR8_MAGGI|nr:protoporphyrinogen oxidase [Crassostrea gigas]